MNICFIGPQAMRAVSGGVDTQAGFTAKCLQELGEEITFYNPWERYNWEKIDIAHIFRAGFDTYSIAQFLYEIKKPFVVSPVFYSLHSPIKIKSFLLMSKLARKVCKGILTDLDCVHDICQFSSGILPNTNKEKELIKEALYIPYEKSYVIPNGVEERFANSDPSIFVNKYGIKDFILSVGNLGYKRKNMLNLIYALEKIDHPAVLIGAVYNNEYGLKCRERIEKSKNILWLDAIAHEDPMLASVYAACKVFALPSLFETPGIAALEAALAGANIVITEYGGTKEYFKDMAEYVKPDNISSIRETILKALSYSTNTKLKMHILSRYTWPEVVEKTLAVYNNICRK